MRTCRLKNKKIKIITEAFGFKHKTTINFSKIKNIVKTSNTSITIIFDPLKAVSFLLSFLPCLLPLLHLNLSVFFYSIRKQFSSRQQQSLKSSTASHNRSSRITPRQTSSPPPTLPSPRPPNPTPTLSSLLSTTTSSPLTRKTTQSSVHKTRR